MINSPLVSVIVPIYNEIQTLPYFLNDLQSQSFSNVEFILVNDGSTDESQRVIEEFIEKNNDSRFVLIKQDNAGVSVARNNGISKSRGQYIMFADADDRLDENFVKGYVEKIIKNNSDIEVFSLKKIDDINSLHVIENVDYSRLDGEKISYSNFFEYLADGIIHGYVVSYITKKSLWEKIKFDKNIKYREDEFAYCQMLILHPDIKINFNKESYYYYFIHSESITNMLSPNDVLKSIKISDSIIKKANLVRHIDVPMKTLNQLKSNFYWKMIVVSIIKGDKNAFKMAKISYLNFYPKTNFYFKKNERKIIYILLKLHLDFILKILIKKIKASS